MAKQGLEPITFDDYINGRYSYKLFNGTWWSNTEIQWTDEHGNLVLWDMTVGSVSILVSAEQLASFSGYSKFVGFSPDSSNLELFYSNREGVWRHSYLANYDVFESITNTTFRIVPRGMPSDTKLQYCNWIKSPVIFQSRLVYVYNNNLFIRQNWDDPNTEYQITNDGHPTDFYNAIPDWVYEEEILSTNKAMYWTDSGNYLAFAKFDDSQVEEFHYTKYGNPADPYGNQYPNEIAVKYPKVGTTNPTFQLQVVDCRDLLASPKDVVPPVEVTQRWSEYLYTTADWVKESPDTLSVIWMNRIQSESIVSECEDNGAVWQCTLVYETSEPNGWLDLFQPPVFRSDGNEMIEIQSQLDLSSGLHYRHIMHLDVSVGAGGAKNFLTSGQYVVTRILGWDESAGRIFFMGTREGVPGERHLYSVSDQVGAGPETCHTCNLNMPTAGAPCKYSYISLSPDQKNYVQSCSGPEIPEVVVRDTATHSISYVLENNDALRDKLIGKALAERVFLEVTVPGGYSAPVRMLLPPDYATSGKRYAALVDVYGGPDSQEVNYRWYVGWGDYLATNYDIVYISIDGRGTGYQSNEYEFLVYGKLGTVEMEDQIGVMQELETTIYPNLFDSTKTGIWGWSYGGYSTLQTLVQDDDNVYECGLAVAPPTDWLMYDSMYTERYMRLPTPQDNQAGYNTSSLLYSNKLEKLRGKVFQINHGVADDNVHFQHSMLLFRYLELLDIHFEQNVYPEENHSISSVSKFLYENFDKFWSRCFGYTLAVPVPP